MSLFVPVIGWRPAGGAAAPTLALLGAAGTGFDNSIEMNGAAQAGDPMLCWNIGAIFDADGPPGAVTPSGFTSIINRSYDPNSDLFLSLRVQFSVRIHDGSEATRSGINADAGGDEAWALGTFRPSAPFAAFASSGVNNPGVAGGNPPAQTIAVGSAATRPILAWGLMASTTSQAAIVPSVSPAMTQVNLVAQMKCFYKIFNEGDTVTDISFDMNDAGANIMASGYLTFS